MNGNQTEQSSDEEKLLGKLRDDKFGGEANNGSLRDALGWQPDRFWAVRNRLLENGRVQKAHGGPGGKTVLVPAGEGPPFPQTTPDQTDVVDENTNQYNNQESALYIPMQKEIDSNWSA